MTADLPDVVRGDAYRTNASKPDGMHGSASSDACTRTLLALLAYNDERPYPPTLRELSQRTGYSLTQTADAVHALSVAGLVQHEGGGRPRTLVPLVERVR